MRARIALGVVLPVLVAMVLLSLMHYRRQTQLMEQQLELTAVHVGEVALGSLHHALLGDDRAGVEQILIDVVGSADVQRVLLVNGAGRIVSAGGRATVKVPPTVTSAECAQCHQYAADARPRTVSVLSSPGTIRVSTPVENLAECQACHGHAAGHLGVLLMDVSLGETRARILRDLRTDLAASLALGLLVAAGVFLLVQRLVVHRVELMKEPLASFASGDFSARLPTPTRPRDELDALALEVNHMAGELDRWMGQRERLHRLRYEAIVEERDRLAREMHDGIAQIIAYVSAKSSAIRVLVSEGRVEQALLQLRQLADASQDALQDIRAAIFGLRTPVSSQVGLGETLEQHVEKFSELIGLGVDLRVHPAARSAPVSPEGQAQLVRITQEALMNIHKHAHTDNAWVELSVDDGWLVLSIGDRGRGFDVPTPSDDGQVHFGLGTMRERAESIGAEWHIYSQPGSGTRVTVRLPEEVG